LFSVDNDHLIESPAIALCAGHFDPVAAGLWSAVFFEAHIKYAALTFVGVRGAKLPSVFW
jgi:hypothetical protein